MSKTRIRLAVAVDINGDWKAAGWSWWEGLTGSHNASDDDMATKAADGVVNIRGGDPRREHRVEVQFVEVDIEIPQRLEAVRGRVVS